MLLEYSTLRRSVVLDSDHPNVGDPAFGRKTGRFDNDTLFIESSGFPAWSVGLTSGRGPNGNVPSCEQERLLDCISVSHDGSQLPLACTVTDPALLTKSFTDAVTWHRTPDDAPIDDFDCDAGIAGRSTQNAAPITRN